METQGQAPPTSSAGPGRVNTVKPAIATLGFFLVAVLGCANFLLIRQNVNLKKQVGAAPKSMQPVLGSNVPALEGVDPTGNRITLSYGQDARPTLLLVFSTKCGACTVNWHTWDSVVHAVDKTKFRVVYVDVFSPLTGEYVREYGISNSIVFAETDPKSIVAYNLQLTPETLLVSPQAKIENVWLGVLEGEELASLEKALRIGISSSRRGLEGADKVAGLQGQRPASHRAYQVISKLIKGEEQL